MNTHLSLSRRHRVGFTIIELLVVISIIGILMGLLLPVLSGIKNRARVKIARSQMASLITAIKQYEAEYSRMPVSREAFQSTSQAKPDFTYGTVNGNAGGPSEINKNVIDTRQVPSIISFGFVGGDYRESNRELMAMLQSTNILETRDVTDPLVVWLNSRTIAYNPRHSRFFEAKHAIDEDSQGIGSDGVLRDPWGNAYGVTIDLNDDDICMDGFYADARKNATNPTLDPGIKGSVLVWSLGPDGKGDPNKAPKEGVNEDNVLSWED